MAGSKIPLVFSPGPISVIAAVSGAKVGYRKSLPLFLGINIVYFSYSVAAGVGLGFVIQAFPWVLTVMRYIGALFVAYLGVTLILRAKGRSADVKLGFWEGVVVQALNPKFPAVLISMYSAFLVVENQLIPQVLIMSLAILCLNIVSQAAWCGAVQIRVVVKSGVSV